MSKDQHRVVKEILDQPRPADFSGLYLLLVLTPVVWAIFAYIISSN